MISGIDALKPFIAEGRYFEAAAAIALIRNRNPGLGRQIDRRIPALVVNNDKRFHDVISSPTFRDWEAGNPDWADSVRNAARRPSAFAGFVDAWLEELAEFDRARRNPASS